MNKTNIILILLQIIMIAISIVRLAFNDFDADTITIMLLSSTIILFASSEDKE